MNNIDLNLNFLLLLLLSFIIYSCNKNDDDNKDTKYFYYQDYKFEEPAVTGKDYYIDPVKGSPYGDGSYERPWRTLQEVIENNLIEFYMHTETNNANSPLKVVNEGAPVKGGDRLLLMNGYHGFINLNNFIFKEWITIQAQEGHSPLLSRFKLEGAFEKIYLKGLVIIKDSYTGDGNYWEVDALNRNSNACLYLGSSEFWGKGRRVKLNGITVKTTNNTSKWTANDWVQKSASGISLRSVEYVEVVNCQIENVKHGLLIEYFSDNCAAVNNSIINYCADGSRIISNNVLFADNIIIGCLKVDDNHDDAIQSYTRGANNSVGTSVLSNVTIRGNLIIGMGDNSNPLASSPQGIGCFDGFFENWIVENNVIIVNHYHGISFYGMRNGKIINNTVIDQIPDDDISPWIMITDHKSGAYSKNCVIANNIISSAVIAEGEYVEEYNNYVFGKNNYNLIYDVFINPDINDFHLQHNDFTSDNIIDKGKLFKNLVSSRIDKDGLQRTWLPDLGAYESAE
jgi:parallel beta-helix repeat protein